MPSDKVIATDLSPQMLAIAKTRATLLGLDDIMEFTQIDGEKLDFPDSDAKLTQFFPDGG